MNSASKQLSILILSAIIVQLSCHYWGASFNTEILGLPNDTPFRWFHFFARNLLPIVLIPFVLKIPRSESGFTWPTISRRLGVGLLGAAVILAIAIFSLRYSQSYVGYYSSNYSNSQTPPWDRIQHFAIFTFSTLIGWEILHRGLLLFGIRYILRDRAKVDPQVAATVAILVAASFESLFHMVKPPFEAFGLAFGSPLLSLIAFRTGSMLIPLFIHLGIELGFILMLVL